MPAPRLILLPFLAIKDITAWAFYLLHLPFHYIGSLFQEEPTALYLKIEEQLPFTKSKGIQSLIQGESPSLTQIEQALKMVHRLEGPENLVIDIRNAELSFSQLHTLKEVIQNLKGELKIHLMIGDCHLRYLTFTDIADHVLSSPTASFLAIPPGFQSMYFSQLLKKIGIRAQGIHIGDFKTAYNRFARRQSSDAERLMMQNLHSGIADYIEQRVRQRLIDPTLPLDDFYRRGIVSAKVAQVYGLVDRLVYPTELYDFFEDPENYQADHPTTTSDVEKTATDTLKEGEPPTSTDPLRKKLNDVAKELTPLPKELERLKGHVVKGADSSSFCTTETLPNLLEWERQQLPRPKLSILRPTPSRVGILRLEGVIMPDEGSHTPSRRSGATITPNTVHERLQAFSAQSLDALLLVVNSPGGSATASEEVWHMLKKVSATIPMVTYCGDVAASGGYYLAVASDYIYCDPTSIVGSIGVVTAQISAKTLLQRLNIAHEVYGDELKDSPFNIYRDISLQNTTAMLEGTREFYQTFLDRVGQARPMLSKRMLHRSARGRVYLGNQANFCHLVDGDGGYQEAIMKLRSLLEIDEKRPLKLIEQSNEELNLRALLRSKLLGMGRMRSGLQELLGLVTDESQRSRGELSELLEVARLMRRGEMLAYESCHLEV